MDSQNEKRIQLYNGAPAGIKALYGSEELGKKLRSIAKSAGLVDGVYGNFSLFIGDIVLGLSDMDDLTQKLQTDLILTPNQSQQIYSQLEQYLPQVILKAKETLHPISATDDEGDAEDIEQTNTPKEATFVEPMRTMETDTKRAHGYGAGLPEETVHQSAQDDVVAPKSDEPKWGSSST